jgi:LuxR family transcriptional regulator, maltose regulon positive regulatory protein
MSGPATGTTDSCARCCGPNCGPGTRLAGRCFTCVQPNGSRPPATAGARPVNTAVTTVPQVTSYLIDHSAQLRPDPFTEQLTAAASHVRSTQPSALQPGQVLAEPLTAAEQRVLKLLPDSTYLQMAEILYVSRNTVKTHLRSIYQKLGATSRSQALQRAVDLRLL